jgi:hypothetical protein
VKPLKKIANSLQHSDFQFQHRMIVPLFIFNGNYEELKNNLGYFNSKAGMDEFMAMRLWYKRDKFLDHLTVLIINFVASAKMMVRHCERAVEKANLPDSFLLEYKRRKQELVAGNIAIALVHLLNDYYIHHFNHPLTWHEDFNRSFEDKFGRYTAERDRLIRFAERKLEKAIRDKNNTEMLNLVLAYLRKAPKEIEIENFIEQYFTQVNSFYIWILETLKP